jgi:hypothetical protein
MLWKTEGEVSLGGKDAFYDVRFDHENTDVLRDGL